MDSSAQYTPFIITDKDLEEEFNPDARRSNRQTKEQALYGIWADEQDQPLKTHSKRGKYVGFVRAGYNNEEPIKISKPSKNFKKPTKKTNTDSQFGQWERHTKGIGMKLLRKQGFKPGEGLGQTRQGISTPIVAVKKEGKESVGYRHTVTTETQEIDRSVEKPSSVKGKWKKTHSAVPNLITTEELILKQLQNGANHFEVSQYDSKVIDLTGPEAKIYSDYRFFGSKLPEPGAFSVNELIHNLNLLVQISEREILDNERASQSENATIQDLEFHFNQMTHQEEVEAVECECLERVSQLIEECVLRQEKGTMSASFLHEMFRSLISVQPALFVDLDLAQLASCFLRPLFEEEVGDASFLVDPAVGVDFMRYWQRIFLSEQMREALNNLPGYSSQNRVWSPYDRLIWDLWLGRARGLVTEEWNPREPDKLMLFLDIWRPITPRWIFEYFVTKVVVPKVQEEVRRWSPMTDPHFHLSIIPLSTLFGGITMRGLYEVIIERMGACLAIWHPTENQGHDLVHPWAGVIPSGLMETFLIKRILPKLTHLLQNTFTLDPRDQKLDSWFAFIQWHDIVPQQHMVAMLDKLFFPVFLDVLGDWLRGIPDYGEINKWYLGWKSMFPGKYVEDEILKGRFRESLSMMDCAFTATRDGSFNSTDSRRSSKKMDSMMYLNVSPSVAPMAPNTFKDLVAHKAAESGIEFYPIASKFIGGKQVYRFGGAQLYVDRDVVYLLMKGKWQPESLNNIISRRLYMS